MTETEPSNEKTTAAPTADLAAEELREDFERVKKLAQEYLDGWKRAKADYLNLRREVDKEKGELIAMANAGLLLELIPIYDHFKLALNHLPKEAGSKDWLMGLEQVRRQFQELFRKLGVEEVKSVGQTFNPELHEAIAKAKVAEAAPNTVLEELRPGYTLAGRVIQPAQVKVAE